MVQVAEEDAEVNAAMQQAQDTIGIFVTSLQSPKPTQSDFSIKARFISSDGGVEHIWIVDVSYSDEGFTGVINNVPVDVPEIEQGDNATVPVEDVSDWMFIEDGKLVGGYTIRVLRNRLSPEERERFDEETDFIIDD